MEQIKKIYVVGFDFDIRRRLEYIISNNTPCDVFSFTSIDDFYNYKYRFDADIYILDEKGFEIFDMFCTLNKISASILFLLNNDYKEIKKIEKSPRFTCNESDYIIFDFLNINFTPEELMAKINLLVKISDHQKQVYKIDVKTKLKDALWEVLYYSKFYVIICDRNLKVKVINSKLMKDLKIKSRKDILGTSMLDFIDDNFKFEIKSICEKILKTNDTYEACIDIINKENERISVKWYNSFVNKGNNYILGIGVPIPDHIRKDDNIDMIRQHYKDMIQKDKIMIENIKKKQLHNLSNVDDKCNLCICNEINHLKL